MIVSISLLAVATTLPCHDDSDCPVRADHQWRCLEDKTAALPAGNCHLPGPGMVGNSSCSCQDLSCSAVSPTAKNASALQYLMIGDSISLGMEANVNATVAEHGWELTHTPGNAASANKGDHCLGNWTTPTRKWDVISANFGLHDLGYDVERLTPQQYGVAVESILTKLVDLRNADGTKLLWVRTTPVPDVPVYDVGGPCNDTKTCINPPRYDSDVRLFNEVADKIATAKNIPILDLYTFVINKCGGEGYKNCTGFQLPCNVHYTSEGWASLSTVMSDALLKL